jgi:hypothetical protein
MPGRQAGQVSPPSYDSSGTDTSDNIQQLDIASASSEQVLDVDCSKLIKRMDDAKDSVLAGKLQVLPELLGPLFTADLQGRLKNCKSLEQMFPEMQQEATSHCTDVAAAAEGFALVGRRPGEQSMSAACAMEVRMLATVVDQPLTDSDCQSQWVDAVLLADEEPLPAHITRLLRHAATLQHSPELTSADRLATNAMLPRIIQRCPAAALLSSMTAGDILAMRRCDLPALWASLAAADVCTALMWRAATVGCHWHKAQGVRLPCTAGLLVPASPHLDQPGNTAHNITLLMQAFRGLVNEMRPVVSSTTNPWIHTIYTWACAQQLSIRMHTAYTGLALSKVIVCITTLALYKECSRATWPERWRRLWWGQLQSQAFFK